MEITTFVEWPVMPITEDEVTLRASRSPCGRGVDDSPIRSGWYVRSSLTAPGSRWPPSLHL